MNAMSNMLCVDQRLLLQEPHALLMRYPCTREFLRKLLVHCLEGHALPC